MVPWMCGRAPPVALHNYLPCHPQWMLPWVRCAPGRPPGHPFSMWHPLVTRRLWGFRAGGVSVRVR
eukprot:4114132-Pyramimonas_sp.AAC.1